MAQGSAPDEPLTEMPPENEGGGEEESPPKDRTRRVPSYPKQILRRLRLTRDLTASLRVHEDELAEALEEVLSPFLEEEERLDWRTLVRVLRRMIQDREDRLHRAAENRHQEKNVEALRRVELRQRTAEVRRLLLELRRMATGLYGKERAEAFLGLTKRTARYPTAVLNDGKAVLKRLANPERPLPEPRFAHGDLGRDRWHALLEGPVRGLERAHEAHGRDETETETAVIKKDMELDQHDHHVNWAARWVVAMYSLAGRESWTSDLDPVSRHRQRRRRRSSAEGEIESGAGEPTAQPSAEPSPQVNHG